MLKNKTKFIVIVSIIFILLSSTIALANNDVNYDNDIMLLSQDNLENTITNEISNAQNQQNSYKKSDVYFAGDKITIDYIVDGNVFICANSVTINSQIGGDVFIVAKDLKIEENASIYNNLFAVANTIDVKGLVYDIYAVAQTLNISKGYISRDIKVSCNTVNINGTIGRNAFINCDSLNFNTDSNTSAIIYGDLNYSASVESSIPENTVAGKVTYSQITNDESSTQEIISSYILNLGSFTTFVAIIWLICLWIAPKFLDSTNKYIGNKTLSVLGTGLLTLIVVPIACIILLLLQLTSTISLLLLAIYILAIAISKTIFTIAINNYICSKANINKNLGKFGMLILSSIVIWAITKIPYIGSIISFITIIIGLGILVASILPKKQPKNVSESEEE